jgi:putative aldouronate transport system permease protein
MMGKTLVMVAENGKKRGFFHYVRKDFLLYIMLVLPIGYFLTFRYVPMYGVLIAFKDYNLFRGVFGSQWVGFDVFKEIFVTKEFYRSVKNTLLLNSLDLLVGFPAPLILAILLNELRSQTLKKIANTVLYIPHFLSWVIIGAIVIQLLSPRSGMLNSIIISLGGSPIPFLTNGPLWVVTYVLVGVWQNIGWGSIIFLAAISAINPELYEAAEMDGAGRLRRTWNVTLPCIRSCTVALLILSIGRVATIEFERPFLMGNQLVMQYQDVISTFVYRVGLQNARFSVATAVGLFQSVVGLVFLLTAQFTADKFGERGIW